MQAKFEGQSELRTHSGRQLGTDPIMPSWQPHCAWLLTTWHLEFGPKSKSKPLTIITCLKFGKLKLTTWRGNTWVSGFAYNWFFWTDREWLAPNKRITSQFLRAVTNGVVVGNAAHRILSTHSWTRISTFLVDAGLGLRTLRIRLLRGENGIDLHVVQFLK